MNKIAHFLEYYRNAGSTAALNNLQQGHTKQAGMSDRVARLASGRLGKLLGVGAAATGAGLGYQALRGEDPGMLESMAEGGKEMLSNLDPDTLAQYGAVLNSLSQAGGGYGSMGYDASQPSPMDYGMQDIAYDPSMMGYEATMSPSEESVYYDYNNDDTAYSDPFSSSGYDAGYGGGYGY
jgi:hypothetical protein